MDKDKALTLLTEIHDEKIEELEDQVYGIGESYRQEREYNYKLENQNKRYREAIYNAERKCDGEASSILKQALEGDPNENS